VNPKNIIKQLNIVGQCKEYNLPLWQCPQFFFLITGIITIAIILAGYTVGTRIFENPLLAAWIVVGVAGFLLIVNFALSRAFGKVAEANRMKSEFIRVISHQLRSPLSNIRWSTEFLMSQTVDNDHDKKQKYFKILEENIARMQELISNLLTASRIEAGTLVFNIEEFSLAEFAKEVISKFRPSAEASNVNISLKASAASPPVKGDSSQIKVVIENLLDNAIRYTRFQPESKAERGRIQIRISQKRNKVFFEIEDNGMGIPKTEQPYIFQRFFRGKQSMRRQALGSGLGLYISKSIIEKSGGEMGFYSEPDRGSTFWFTLPTKD